MALCNPAGACAGFALQEHPMQMGVVKYFDGRSGKEFGFLIISGSETEIFFHRNDGRLNLNRPHETDSRPSREPLAGDTLIFKVHTGKNGKIRAYPWVFAEPSSEPSNVAVYRIIVCTQPRGLHRTEKEVWYGSNLDALNTLFPRHQDYAHDTLARTKQHGRQRWTRFEVKVGDGTWEICPDPRTIVP